MQKFVAAVARIGSSTLIVSLSLFATPAAAQTTIVSGYGTLSQEHANQLGAWLGEGPIRITNIFTKVGGDGQNAATWRSAVWHKGRTFTAMRVHFTLDGIPYTRVVGGYNPVSWDGVLDYRNTPANADRKAFIFDLTNHRIQRQDQNGEDGLQQTHNDNVTGPTWGNGHDLRAYSHLGNGDASGSTYNGTAAKFSNSLFAHPGQEVGATGSVLFGIDQMEVFTIENDAPAVPEPGSLALFLPALALVGWVRRRRSI